MTSAGHQTMLGRPNLPYRPIAGVKSDGTAYCALPGRINASSGAYEADITILNSTYSGDWHPWGAHGGASAGYYFMLNIQAPTTIGAFAFGYYTPSGTGSDILHLYAGRHLLKVANNSSGRYAELDGVSKRFSNSNNGPFVNPGQFLVFRASATNSQTNPQASVSPTFLVIHSLKVWYADTLVADLVSCQEKATSEVCFFNLVDNTFVKNVVAGAQLYEWTGGGING